MVLATDFNAHMSVALKSVPRPNHCLISKSLWVRDKKIFLRSGGQLRKEISASPVRRALRNLDTGALRHLACAGGT